MKYILPSLIILLCCNSSSKINSNETTEKNLVCLSGTYIDEGMVVPISECYSSKEDCYRSTESMSKDEWTTKTTCIEEETTWCFAIYAYTLNGAYTYLNCYKDEQTCSIQNTDRLGRFNNGTFHSKGCAQVSEKDYITYKSNSREQDGYAYSDEYESCKNASVELILESGSILAPPEPHDGGYFCTALYGAEDYPYPVTWEEADRWTEACTEKYIEDAQRKQNELAGEFIKTVSVELGTVCSSKVLSCEEQIRNLKREPPFWNSETGFTEYMQKCIASTGRWGLAIRPTVYGIIDKFK